MRVSTDTPFAETVGHIMIIDAALFSIGCMASCVLLLLTCFRSTCCTGLRVLESENTLLSVRFCYPLGSTSRNYTGGVRRLLECAIVWSPRLF